MSNAEKFSSSVPLLQTLKNGARTTASQITAHFTSNSICITRMCGEKQETNKKPINGSDSIQTKRAFLSPPPTDANLILDLTFNACLPVGWAATTACANSAPSFNAHRFLFHQLWNGSSTAKCIEINQSQSSAFIEKISWVVPHYGNFIKKDKASNFPFILVFSHATQLASSELASSMRAQAFLSLPPHKHKVP